MRLPRLTKRKVITAIFFIIMSLVVQFIPTQKKEVKQNNSLVKVTKVIDGDTVEIDTGQKVRYIGINTPEIFYPNKQNECFAIEAREKNKELVEGKIVRLEKDVSETDKYGRLLRYVYFEGQFINKTLLSEGYARIMTIPPDLKYYPLFKEEQNNAKENKKGLWNQCL